MRKLIESCIYTSSCPLLLFVFVFSPFSYFLSGTEYYVILSKASMLTQIQYTGIKAKVENKNQYQQYLDELKPLREELGVELKEDLYPEEK